MSEQDLSKTQGFLIVIICIAIVVTGLLWNKFLKDNDIIDTYGDYIENLHKKMDTWDCEKLLKWGYFVPSGLYSMPNEETTYAKDLARIKCPNDESWLNPPVKIKEPVPTMDELYDKWSKKK